MQAPPDIAQQEHLRQKSEAWAADTRPIATISPAKKRVFRRPFWSELWRWAVVAVIFLVLSVGLLTASLLAAIYWQAAVDQSKPVDAIVVLGAAQYNGTPSPVLKARLDEAAAAYK